MKLIFIGPQGSGKGTQAKKIAERLGLCHISSGDLLRSVEGDLREEVKRFMDKGKLVPDELMVSVLREKLKDVSCEKGFILDGFPRNISQTNYLKNISDIDRVVEIAISDEESIRRVGGRRVCGVCSEIYNINTSPIPKVEGVCDKCGGVLVRREDDNEDVLRERLKIYHEETEAILKMYTFMRINGEQSIEKVEADILEGIGGA